MRLGTTKRAVAIYATIFTLLIALLFLGRALSAQKGGQYDLSWSSINGGGEMFSIGGEYVLGATIGQPGAGRLAGGDYLLDGGFWHCFPLAFDCPVDSTNPTIYLPMLITVPDK